MINKKQLILNQLIENRKLNAVALATNLEIPLRTIQREIAELKVDKLISVIGAGQSTTYSMSTKGLLFTMLDNKLLDDRRFENMYLCFFNDEIFDALLSFDIFENDNSKLALLASKYHKKIRSTNEFLKKRELERLIVEFSWKSSMIEGNTYSLLETEELLYNNNFLGTKHSKEETQMILNHKEAFEFLIANPDYFKELTKKKIIELHTLLTKDMDIPHGFRKSGVGITGSLFKPLDNQHQIEEMIERTCDLINKKSPYEKAFLIGLLISYIQPFDDGNKRTSRILSNAILNAYDLPMLSFRSIRVEDYKTAILAFYEFNSLPLYKKIFINQIEYFVDHYF
jgi:fido (protein-threonine AMPylation protein)